MEVTMPVAIILLVCGVGFLVTIVLLMFVDQLSFLIWVFVMLYALSLAAAFFWAGLADSQKTQKVG